MNRFLTCLLFFFAIGTVFSQATDSTGWSKKKGGLMIGFNVTEGEASGIGAVYDWTAGFSIGFFYDMKTSKNGGIETGIIIDRYNSGYFFGFPSISAVDRFTYLSIPFYFQMQASKGFNLNTGPKLGILLSATSESDDVDLEFDVDDFVKGGLWQWGFGMEFNTRANIDIGLRYLIGLNDINDARDIIDSSYNLHTAILYVGFGF